jgi:hypothetical protein
LWLSGYPGSITFLGQRGELIMAWKKAWPTQIKDGLKKKGLSDADIKTLESYGSLEMLRKDPKKALKSAKIDELCKQLTQMGVM